MWESSVLEHSRHEISEIYLPRIKECLKRLPEKDIWWRPNAASNSVGNLVLHLEGNVRQWIISGLGGEPDRRERDREFAERGPISRRALLLGIQKTVTEADRVLAGLQPRELKRKRAIQKFNVTGLEAVLHVTGHFIFHTGQIIYVTKLRLGNDLGFTRLPGTKVTGKKKSFVSV